VIRVQALVKENIVALLRARRVQQQDLAVWCRRDVSKETAGQWLSKILGSPKHNLPLEYWNRVADFFNLEPYQLLQPGIAASSERRRGGDRRAGRERRMSRRMMAIEPTGDLMDVWAQLRGMSLEDVALLRRFLSSLRSHAADSPAQIADRATKPADTGTTPQRTRRKHRA
jgi:hypothetical protein